MKWNVVMVMCFISLCAYSGNPDMDRMRRLSIAGYRAIRRDALTRFRFGKVHEMNKAIKYIKNNVSANI